MESSRDQVGACTRYRVRALEVGASELTGLEPWKSKLVLGKYRLELGRLESSSRVGALYHYCTLLIVKKKLIKACIPSLFILCSKYK